MNQFTLKFCVHCRAEKIANDAKAAVSHYKDELFYYHTEIKETRMKCYNLQMENDENESTVLKLHERSRDEYKQYKKQIHSLQEQIKELKSEKEIKNK